MTDITQTPNTAGVGIQKSLTQEIGAGRGDEMTPESSIFLIKRDPFRAINRGRQLFQRKFTAAQGVGPRLHDGIGDIQAEPGVGAGLSDSCASCHGRPFGAAGSGGNVFTRPDSRDAPHLFGLGIKEMLGDEMTQDLRQTQTIAIASAIAQGTNVTLPLVAKGVSFGSITAHADGSVDTSGVQGVNSDLRVRPFFAQGKATSIREFAVGAFKAEMGLEAPDVDLLSASQGADVVTPSGMLLSGTLDAVDAPPVRDATTDGDHDGVVNEVPVSVVDYMEFYLLNYFKPGRGPTTQQSRSGLSTFNAIGCIKCHVSDLGIRSDRRVADVDTAFDPNNGNIYSRFFATAAPLFTSTDDGSGFPTLKLPSHGGYQVKGIFTDLKRHDLGIAFHERNFDGTVTTQFMTTPLWGVGSTAPYGHDGRSATLEDVILRHGGEAQAERDAFTQLADSDKSNVLAFLRTLVLFSPPDTPSNLKPADKNNPQYPLVGHGSIDLSVLFIVPADKE